ncbi:MAG: glycosyltransferase family 2 protein [Chloroflexota bacterium]|nr:glycosyltransferase family 2 protein [Chloroflexota bacterium]
MSPTPKVSVVISNWNSTGYLLAAVDSVFNSRYPDLEVVVVDDCSTRDDPRPACRKYEGDPRFRLLVNETNAGLATVFNRGLAASGGEYVLLMHSDTRLDPECIAHLARAMQADASVGAAQGKVLSSERPNIIQSVGQPTIDYLGMPLHGFGSGEEDRGQYDQPREVFNAWPACMMVRPSVVKKVGPFDPVYFFWYEDVDLGWRLWLTGHRIIFVPEARAWHRSRQVTDALPVQSAYYNARNLLLTLVKNYGVMNLLAYFPPAYALILAKGAFQLLRGHFRLGWAVLRGVAWVPAHPGYLWRARRQVQRLRRVPDSTVQRLMAKPSLRVYLGRLR